MPVRRSSNHIPLSPVEGPPMKTGIVTILGADCQRNSRAGSIRKTLSADMSSKKWLEQNGFFSPMKKIISSQEIVMAADHNSDEEEFEENPNQDQVWRSIQAQKEKKNEVQKPAQSGVWELILTQKSDNSLLQAPYVHPMMERSKSSMSEKSLEICTESLGSETGSDCFSCHEDGDHHEEREEKSEREEEVRGEGPFADLHVVKYKKSPARPFPPPLPSISAADGESLHMHSHRENGRLVLEAVSVAPRNYFHAHRQNGRLRLTLKNAPPNLHILKEEEKVEFEKVFDDMEAVGEDVVHYGGSKYNDDGFEEEEEEEEEKEEKEAPEAVVMVGKSGGRKEEFMVEQNLSLPTGMISVHKSMKRLMAVGNNINPKWSDDVATRGGKEDQLLPIPQSLPPRTPVARLTPPAAVASFNAYEYFWRSKPGFMNPAAVAKKNEIMNQDLVMHVRSCKEARRSLLWEPYCIATS